MHGRKTVFCWLAASFILGSCSSVQTAGVWKEETYLGGPVKKIFILGAFTEAGIRRLVENESVLQLKSEGTEAIASHAVLSLGTVEKEETIQSIVKEQGCDAVILIRSRGKNGAVTYQHDAAAPRTFSDHLQEFYRQGYAAVPAYSWDREQYGLEADLFEAGTGRLIWRSLFDVTAKGPVVQEMMPLVGIMIKQLRADRLIR